MSAAATLIGVSDVSGGYLVSLPPRLALAVSLRKSFRKVTAAAEPWTYFVPLPAARLGEWLAEVELQALGERRRRAWSASDAEWEGAPVASPAPTAVAAELAIIRLPSKRTAKTVLELLDRMAAGETLIAGSGAFTLSPSGRPVPAGAARRAIEQRLIVPSCDGLFGPETSQSWRAPTTEETDAATERSRQDRAAGGQRGQDHRPPPVPSPARRRPRRSAPTREQGSPVGDASRRGMARRGGAVA